MPTTYVPKPNKKVILKRCPELVKKSEDEKREKERNKLENLKNEPNFNQRESNYAEARAKYFGPEDEAEELNSLRFGEL